MFIRYLSAALFLLTLSACGGGDNQANDTNEEPNNEPVIELSGVFLDSPVAGLTYTTTSNQGITDEEGRFTFQANDQVTFSIGDITFPSVAAKPYITPLDIFQQTDINDVAVVNMLRLLQSLDTDGDATNNIQISDNAHSLAMGLSIDFMSPDFDSLVADLITMNEGVYQQLISADEAIYHFQQTLAMLGNNNDSCEKTHAKVGYTGYFETFHHNVSGLATIIDDCTISISQFSYDGEGPDVFFYGAIDHDYASEDAFPLGSKLNGQVYDNAELIIKLPVGKTLDDLTGLSVWCVDFNADFGHMEFTP